MVKALILCSVLWMSWFAQGQMIRVGLFSEASLKTVQFQSGNGNFFFFNDTGFVQKLQATDVFTVTLGISKKMDVKLNGVYLMSCSKVQLIQEKAENYFTIKPIAPAIKERSYEGDFELTSNGTKMTLVNVLDIENYLEGVVESESGTGQNQEYYKAQAIISRTYALKYWSKHNADGYNVCDRVHCQAYLHRRLTAHLIDSAVRKTAGVVMLDEAYKLYPTYFHANCGGQTCEPGHIWNENLPGFETFRDTFCIRTKQANWEKRIPVSEWTAFMVKKYDFPVNDSTSLNLLYNFKQDQRQAFFIHPSYGIPLRDVREAFQLKSTFFSCSHEGEQIVIKGKGYGHGVGLCQEGAMNMSRKGYDHKQILEFYYPAMHLEGRYDLVKKR